MQKYNLSYDVVILCGGQGTRLRNLFQDRPKSMVDVGGRPFLDLLLQVFYQQYFRRFILCTGYMGQYVKDYYKNSRYSQYLIFSNENKPLGTGGAIKNAEKYIKSDNFIVVNGDTYCFFPLKKFIRFHLSRHNALASIVVTPSYNRSDAGYVDLDDSNMIVSFREKKDKTRKKLINAGVYILKRSTLSYIPENQNYSLEDTLFPFLSNRYLYGYLLRTKVIDIGMPERYEKALKYFKTIT